MEAQIKRRRAAQMLSWPSPAHGGWGGGGGELAISLMSLSAAQASIIHLTSGLQQGGVGGRLVSLGKRLLTGSVSLHTIPSSYISSSTFFWNKRRLLLLLSGWWSQRGQKTN